MTLERARCLHSPEVERVARERSAVTTRTRPSCSRSQTTTGVAVFVALSQGVRAFTVSLAHLPTRPQGPLVARSFRGKLNSENSLCLAGRLAYREHLAENREQNLWLGKVPPTKNPQHTEQCQKIQENCHLLKITNKMNSVKRSRKTVTY